MGKTVKMPLKILLWIFYVHSRIDTLMAVTCHRALKSKRFSWIHDIFKKMGGNRKERIKGRMDNARAQM